MLCEPSHLLHQVNLLPSNPRYCRWQQSSMALKPVIWAFDLSLPPVFSVYEIVSLKSHPTNQGIPSLGLSDSRSCQDSILFAVSGWPFISVNNHWETSWFLTQVWMCKWENFMSCISKWSLHVSTSPPPLPSLSTPMQPCIPRCTLIASSFLVESFVSNRNKTLGTSRRVKSCKARTPQGFPSPRVF